eukprot:TRINITY_DN5812_c0_g1_i1.p2 TRINITY_DN5812_c0_g1~~TRINITY_DN5812_c0_g1_i1.p2  ORF type:complete len:103 (+),score=0.48 TRINITY_DN5812_c0_g1_i1:591-899(+)
MVRQHVANHLAACKRTRLSLTRAQWHCLCNWIVVLKNVSHFSHKSAKVVKRAAGNDVSWRPPKLHVQFLKNGPRPFRIPNVFSVVTLAFFNSLSNSFCLFVP